MVTSKKIQHSRQGLKLKKITFETAKDAVKFKEMASHLANGKVRGYPVVGAALCGIEGYIGAQGAFETDQISYVITLLTMSLDDL